jgi:coenzyme PQQ precursor peptide PqqA
VLFQRLARLHPKIVSKTRCRHYLDACQYRPKVLEILAAGRRRFTAAAPSRTWKSPPRKPISGGWKAERLLRRLGVAVKIGTLQYGHAYRVMTPSLGGSAMAWTSPKIVEICVGLEINSYACAEV